MNRQEFIDLVGEDPEDMFGSDWQNEVDELELDAETIKRHEEAYD